MQQIIVIVLVILSGIYIYRRMRKTLTVGEDGRKCAHCPVEKVTVKKKNNNTVSRLYEMVVQKVKVDS